MTSLECFLDPLADNGGYNTYELDLFDAVPLDGTASALTQGNTCDYCKCESLEEFPDVPGKIRYGVCKHSCCTGFFKVE